MTFIDGGTNTKIQRQLEYHKIMGYVDEFKMYIRGFERVGVTPEGLTNLAARCGVYVHACILIILLQIHRQIHRHTFNCSGSVYESDNLSIFCKPHKIFLKLRTHLQGSFTLTSFSLSTMLPRCYMCKLHTLSNILETNCVGMCQKRD